MDGHEHKHGEGNVCQVCGAKIKEGERGSKFYCLKCLKDREEQKGGPAR